jgi:TatD DNase family protein
MLAVGYNVSFAGPLTFKNNGSLPDMAARVPLDRLLVETDCPYLAPVPHRGRRNEPAFVRYTAQRLATIHGLSLERLAADLWSNTLRVFPALGAVAVG